MDRGLGSGSGRIELDAVRLHARDGRGVGGREGRALIWAIMGLARS
jgi:hypothetical protein